MGILEHFLLLIRLHSILLAVFTYKTLKFQRLFLKSVFSGKLSPGYLFFSFRVWERIIQLSPSLSHTLLAYQIIWSGKHFESFVKHTKTPWFQRFSRETSCFKGFLELCISFPTHFRTLSEKTFSMKQNVEISMFYRHSKGFHSIFFLYSAVLFLNVYVSHFMCVYMIDDRLKDTNVYIVNMFTIYPYYSPL